MKKELEKAIEKYKKSETSLEAYQAISDFVKIVLEHKEFLKQIEKEGERIRLEKIKLNADKGWNRGLKGKELDEHNRWRDTRYRALHDLDPMFPFHNLCVIHDWMKPENLTEVCDLLFKGYSPDDPLPEADRKEFQLYLDKVYKKIIPFLKTEISEQPEEKLKVKTYNIEKGILDIGKFKIRILRRDETNFGHYILKHIFTSPEGLHEEYGYKEIWKETINDSAKDFNPRSYFRGCENIQAKVSKDTKYAINDFLIFNSIRVKINPIYLILK